MKNASVVIDFFKMQQKKEKKKRFYFEKDMIR